MLWPIFHWQLLSWFSKTWNRSLLFHPDLSYNLFVLVRLYVSVNNIHAGKRSFSTFQACFPYKIFNIICCKTIRTKMQMICFPPFRPFRVPFSLSLGLETGALRTKCWRAKIFCLTSIQQVEIAAPMPNTESVCFQNLQNRIYEIFLLYCNKTRCKLVLMSKCLL